MQGVNKFLPRSSGCSFRKVTWNTNSCSTNLISQTIFLVTGELFRHPIYFSHEFHSELPCIQFFMRLLHDLSSSWTPSALTPYVLYRWAANSAYPLYNRVGTRSFAPSTRSEACDQRGCGTSGFTFAQKSYSRGTNVAQNVGGCCSTNSTRTIDLMLLYPYFHGVTSRTGAPCCFVNSCP